MSARGRTREYAGRCSPSLERAERSVWRDVTRKQRHVRLDSDRRQFGSRGIGVATHNVGPILDPVWTWETIDRDWLRGDLVDYSADEVVEAFERCSRVLGPGWVDRHRNPSSGWTAWGSSAVLRVVRAGALLRALDQVDNPKFTRRLVEDEPSAWSELAALRVLRPDVSVKVEIEVRAPGTPRLPDFTMTGGSAIAYVEVEGMLATAVDRRFATVATELSDGIKRDMTSDWAVSLELSLLPSGDNVRTIRRLVRSELRSGNRDARILKLGPEIGFLEGTGEIAVAPGALGTRSVTIRGWSMEVEVAKAFKRGAAQLPPNRPGVVVIHPGPKGLITPTHELSRLARKGQNTRVAAVVLLREWTGGRSLHFEAFTHLHPTPAVSLPPWLLDRLLPSIERWAGGWLDLD